MDYFLFKDLNQKSSGSLSREDYMMKNYPEFYLELTLFSKNNDLTEFSFKEKLYMYFRKDHNKEKMCVCGKKLKFQSIEKGFTKYCGAKCANKNTVSLIKEIKEKRYGDPNFNNKEKFKESIKKKILEDGESILEKRRKTKFIKYGDPNFTNTEKIQRSKRNTIVKSISDKLYPFDIEILNIEKNSSLKIFCKKCSKESIVHNSTFNARLRKEIDPCPICINYSSGKSSAEEEIVDFINTLGFYCKRNDRSLLNGLEIDIYIESKNIGFEYNGLYWHSELNMEPNYHINKQDLANSLGIKLINIWEDDWIDKKEIIKSKIRHLLGVSENIVFARKCNLVKDIDFIKVKEFLENNHIQGFCPYKNSIGLEYDGNLIALCTFGKRKISGSKYTELLRFTNKIGYHIPGGFSKILKEYIRAEDPKELITFADRSWSPDNNTVYEKNNFEYLYSTKPNYYYIINKKRVHRYSFRKDVLIKEGFDPKLTEREIMLDRGIYRIYDCGQYKFRLKT